MDLELLERELAQAGEPAYRAGQVWEWAARGARGYGEMTNLPAGLRERLAERVPLSALELVREASADDGTRKALFRTAEGKPLEAVLMRFRDGRRSVCVSSQSGCPLTCTFCATGQMAFGRNLTASEILDQALHFRRIEPVDHLVFMGMGEPMMNLEAVLAACERLPDLGITHRRTTISTVGWVPGIRALTEQELPLRLAFSLHAPDEALRSELMPVNDRYPLAEVLEACREHHRRRRRKVFIEYVMLGGVNDRHEHALALAGLLDPKAFKVNLIPYNPAPPSLAGAGDAAGPGGAGAAGAGPGGAGAGPGSAAAGPGGAAAGPGGAGVGPVGAGAGPGGAGAEGARFRGSTPKAIEAFRAALAERGQPVTVRLTRGREIGAACGQLAATA